MMIRGITVGGLCLAAAVFAAPAQAQIGCTAFFDQAAFEEFNLQFGKVMKGVEDFEEAVIDPGGKIPLDDFLQCGVPNPAGADIGFPDGILECNIILQTNVTPGPNPPDPNPWGQHSALFVIGPGFINSNSKKVGEDLFLQGMEASLDLIFTEPNHTGVGFELSRFEGYPTAGWHISVYDKSDEEIGKFFVPPPPGPEPGKGFWGIWCDQTIGRINIYDEAGIVPDAIDNIQMWMEPEQDPTCPWDCGDPPNKMVDIIDFLALLGQWGGPGSCDFNGSGAVDIQDFLKLLGAWGPCPSPNNDKCENQEKLFAPAPGLGLAVHFDMYGATASPESFKCPELFDPTDKDIWYCLNNTTGQTLGVTITTNIDLYIEVNEGCACDPAGPVVACAEGLIGTEQFVMNDNDQVLIRLVDWHDLPNHELKGSMFIDTKPVSPPSVNFFTDRASFDAEILDQGKFMKAVWAFKPDHLPGGVAVPIDDILDKYSHPVNAPNVWDDGVVNLWPPDIDNVRFSSNTNPQGDLQPGGQDAMWYLKPGYLPYINNNALTSYMLPGSFDIISGPPDGGNHTAMALELVSWDDNPDFNEVIYHITVFDKNNTVIGTFVLTSTQFDKPFIGIVTKGPDITIGRVDIWDEWCSYEGISSIELYFQPGNPPNCPSPGLCCQPHSTPGCEIKECCALVCDVDPFCCDVEWDTTCVGHAAAYPECQCP
jgi:hypothetical protein